MSILDDIINARGALQQQAQQKALNPIQLQSQQLGLTQQQLLMHMMMRDPALAQYMQPAQAPQAAAPAAPPGLMSTPPAASGGLLSNVGSPVAQGANGVSTQPYAPGPQGLMQGPQSSAPPSGAQPPQSASGGLPDPWQMILGGANLSGSMFPSAAARGKAMMAAGQDILANDPHYVAQRAQAGSPLKTDWANYQDAQKSGDKVQTTAALMRYLTDSKAVDIANNNNAVTTFGGLTPDMIGMNASNPGQGTQTIGGVQSAIPGAAGAQAAVAGAKAGAESGAEMVPVYAKGGTVPIGFTSRANMQAGAPVPGGSQSPGAPATGPGAPGLQAGASPGAVAQQEATGEESGKYLQSLQDQADAATQTNYSLAQMSSSAKNALLGPAAGIREWMENSAQTLSQLTGVPAPGAKELGNYQMLQKYSNQIAFAASRQLGSREAAQIVQLQMESNPNKALMPQAFAGLVQSMQAMNNYAIAKNTAIQQVSTDQASALKAASTWTSKIDPRVWDLTLGSDLAARFAGQIGAPKIATALPMMASDDQVAALHNLPPSMQAQVLKALPAQFKAQILQTLQGAR